MKAVAFIAASVTTLGLCLGIAAADPYYGPPGAIPAPAPLPAGVLVPVAGPPPMAQMGPQRAVNPRRAQNRAANAELRQALIDRFDANGDGRLEPNERRHAMRALKKMTRKMARQEARAERRAMRAQRAQGAGPSEP